MPRQMPPSLPPEAISHYNKTLLQTLGENAGLRDLRSLETLPGETLLSWLGEISPPAEGWAGQRPLSAVDWFPLLEARALDTVPQQIIPRWGIVTERCSLRRLPSGMAVSRRAGDRYDDLLAETALLPGEPLALLHSSRNGRWFYALSRCSRGWIPISAVGLCESRDAWLSAQEMEDFLVVTGSRFPLPRDPDVSGVCTLSLGMRLRLHAAPARTLLPRDAYPADFPFRRQDGALGFRPVSIPISRPVHRGFLPYRPEHAWALAQVLRGEVYGWGGIWDGWDCSSLVQDVFRCFGFYLPRNSDGLSLLPGSIDVSRQRPEEKCLLLRRQRPGTLLWFPGHIMLYGGERQGRPCCLSAAGRFCPEGSNTVREVNSIVLTSLDVIRPSGETWLQALTRILPIP